MKFLRPDTRLRDTVAEVIVDIELSALSLFRRDLDNTVGSTRTINSCSRGVFQDRDTLDILGREVLEVDIAADDAIDDI
jgi:hypothetical protein